MFFSNLSTPRRKKIIQHRNNLLPYYPKEFALREKTQLYSFTGLKIVEKSTENRKQENSQNSNHLSFSPIHIRRQPSKKFQHRKAIIEKKATIGKRKYQNLQNQIPQRQRIYHKLEEIFFYQKKKTQQRQSSRLTYQPRKDYKIFIPQFMLLKKVEFQIPS